ncbi:MAG TPA: hypothetical protein VFW65_00565 [Pseudonocardiaceae bacterium]|nr:hypothetical protein [Pseudonocardiaceae bacterium]
MTSDDELNNTIDDVIEQYILFLRGRGPEPDLSALPPDRRAAVTEQLKIVSSLADSDPELPPIEDDPVAIRLGVTDHGGVTPVGRRLAATSDEDHSATEHPVDTALRELAFRFRHVVDIDFTPAGASQVPTGMRFVALCTALGDAVAVCVADVDMWSQQPEPVAAFFRHHPNVSAVGLVSEDAERAVVLAAADAAHSIDPVRGWLAPHNPMAPEPLGIALGRHLDRWLPAWDRITSLDELLNVGDMGRTTLEISSEQIARTLRAKPRLAYKKMALHALNTLDGSAVAAVVDDVQARRLADGDLIDRVTELAKAAAT